MTNTPEYRAWHHAIERCYRKNDPRYYTYGARGITVCDEWRHDFSAFFKHIGSRPSKTHQLDRIDNNRGYEPGNVRWATRTENARNKSSNIRIEINGETKTASEWAEIANLPIGTLLQRHKNGWRDAELLGRPLPANQTRAGSIQLYLNTPEVRSKRSIAMKAIWASTKAAGLNHLAERSARSALKPLKEKR